ncbi:sphingosine 1-phosphate receptor 5 [Tachyglossus aculeatus]|uniref:sphingosine 1-phosphate receptor 5 n=1 Tax=Tachyglossus aculeatus TaxID=9261 RepID=UPI0018F5C7D9|nr:sphingosine 1-phosphate receptor 5 [Tachyglossus aculeatus]
MTNCRGLPNVFNISKSIPTVVSGSHFSCPGFLPAGSGCPLPCPPRPQRCSRRKGRTGAGPYVAAMEPADAVLVLHYNYTGKLRGSRYLPGEGVRVDAAAFLAMCALIVLANLAVLLALWRGHPRLRAPAYLLLGSLTLSDLLAGAAYAANLLLSGARTLRLSPALWFAREGGVAVALTASVLSLLAIALERHATMARRTPADARLVGGCRGGRARALRFAAATWAASLGLGALPALGWNCVGRLASCSTVLPLFTRDYVLFCVLVFLAALAAVLALYLRIYRLVHAHAPARPPARRLHPRSLALLRTVAVVLIAFTACWLPLFFLLLVDVACPTQACPVLYQADYFLGLAMVNSLLNPVIYTLTSRDMRRALLRLLDPCCGLRPRSSSGREEDRAGGASDVGGGAGCCRRPRTLGGNARRSPQLDGLDSSGSTGNLTPVPAPGIQGVY